VIPNAEPRNTPLDVHACRTARNYTPGEYCLRLLWTAVWPAFRWSPRFLWRWRAWLLRLFGAKLGSNVRVDSTASIFAPWQLQIGADSSVGYDVVLYNLGAIYIGDRVTISQRAHLCAGTHEYTDPRMPLLKSPITVDDEAWVCADAFVGPNVHIGRRAVVGARAVVVRDVPESDVVVGNPAVRVKTRNIRLPEDNG
jgi:putative colanic acid biosynthesis acetyltransferase WcaF